MPRRGVVSHPLRPFCVPCGQTLLSQRTSGKPHLQTIGGASNALPSLRRSDMKTDQIIEKLNEAVSMEFGAFHMYLQFSLLIHGKDRIKWHEFFEEQSQESLGH